MNRPDFSNYVAHFTSASGDIKSGDTSEDFQERAKMSAKQKLINILQEKKIIATPMPWTHAKAACFTECPWSSLLAHTTRYSPYGIGFSKPFIFSRNGGPALYIRPDHFFEQLQGHRFSKHLWPFITMFAPSYRPEHIKEKYADRGIIDCDYSHEREWRVPHDLPFEYDNVEFIVLKNYEDMAKFPQELKDAIGREKFILMENYKFVEKLWPVHKL